MPTMHKLICPQCSVEFLKEQRQLTASRIKGAEHIFCSQSCTSTYRNKHLEKGARSSKLEQWVAASLTATFPRS